MLRKIPWPWIGLYATLALFGVASYFKWYSMWGINHLAFLPSGWWLVYWLAVAAIPALAFIRDPTPRLYQIFAAIAKFIFASVIWPRLQITIVCFVVCSLSHGSTTPVTGTLVAIFGNGVCISKWAEQGNLVTPSNPNGSGWIRGDSPPRISDYFNLLGLFMCIYRSSWSGICRTPSLGYSGPCYCGDLVHSDVL